ncbi:hypothetical protein [Blastochloris tepida]|uniref:SGNH hydrolase-type esterase domain-containing protein n=1 Tax=Blastochloris tepida TaxID=2233851 RepID=A0A348FWY8_9HYPH|nr:hypothetical protein [Blastochloris tepida]BBF91821.1 hypothetical protein BLTE_05060 [Blastochloris tepida]
MRAPLALAALLLPLAAALTPTPARAQTCTAESAEPCIDWQVKNRFRLFKNEQDFQTHAVAHGPGSTILAVERKLARGTDGFGWARDMVHNLCVDPVTSTLLDRCERTYEAPRTGKPASDRRKAESTLNPRDHRVGLTLRNIPAEPGLACRWTLWDAAPPGRQFDLPCSAEVIDDLAAGIGTKVSVTVQRGEEVVAILESDLEVRDLLVAGMGDSIASGEGNPDSPVMLSDKGFCYRRLLGGTFSEYFRPSRRDYRGMRDCGPTTPVRDAAPTAQGSAQAEWARAGADWMSPACHRSLYGYQVRTALALAVENPHVAITFLPLACTGAQIDEGLLGSQPIRDFAKACEQAAGQRKCVTSVPPQIAQLGRYLQLAPERDLDLLLLTIGANDIGFSPMVAGIMVDQKEDEYDVLNRFGMIKTAKEAAATLQKELPANFRKLRAALKPLLGGSLDHVVYVRYGHPALEAPGRACGGGRHGMDIHPAFEVSAPRLQSVSDFVTRSFFPKLEQLARCNAGGGCVDPETERMTYVDGHDQAFARAGFCATEPADPTVSEPDFDVACFRKDGKSFRADSDALEQPMTDGCSPSDYRPYAPRARWIRTPNDAYFAAMTFPYGVLQAPQSNHDGLWGLKTAVYGGAIHPTAEGHAAMADAAMPAARRLLGLSAPPAILAEPIPPPAAALPPAPVQ